MNALQAVGCSSSKKETDNQWKENSNTHTQESKENDADEEEHAVERGASGGGDAEGPREPAGGAEGVGQAEHPRADDGHHHVAQRLRPRGPAAPGPSLGGPVLPRQQRRRLCCHP